MGNVYKTLADFDSFQTAWKNPDRLHTVVMEHYGNNADALKHLQTEASIWRCEIQHQHSRGEDTTAERKTAMAYTKAIREIKESKVHNSKKETK